MQKKKKKVRNGLVYSSPNFPHGYILHNYYTTWKPGIWHWYNVCIKLYVILWHVNSCDYHCKQDTELFYHHSIRKGLEERIPSYLLGEHVNWFCLNREQYSNIFLKLLSALPFDPVFPCLEWILQMSSHMTKMYQLCIATLFIKVKHC